MELKDVIQELNSYRGDFYNLERKNQYREFLLKLSYMNILGKRLIDVGWGVKSVIEHLPSNLYKKTFIDLSSSINDKKIDSQRVLIQMDLPHLIETTHREFKKFMKKLYAFLGEEKNEDSGSDPCQRGEYVDTIIYSDILNYIDYQRILSSFYKNLKTGGRKIVFNKINMGIQNLFSPYRPRSNWEILRYLQHDLKMVIEYRESYPVIRGDPYEADNAVFIIVARKK